MAELFPRTRAALRAEVKRLRGMLGVLETPERAQAQALTALDAPPGPSQGPQYVGGYHLPSVIRWGQTPASRPTKKGSWYIIVPFGRTTGAPTAPPYRVSKELYRTLQRLPYGGRDKASGIIKASYGPRAFLSFRTITPQSRGWYIPRKRLQPLAGVSEDVARTRMLLAAVQADLKERFGRKR